MKATGSVRTAFTLIELLVVIGIIALLAGILIAVGNMAREAARAAVTVSRMEEVQRAIGALGQGGEGRSAAATIHRSLKATNAAVVRGVGTFQMDPRYQSWSPVAGEDWITPPYRAYEFAHPWGKVPTDAPGDAPTAVPDPANPFSLEPHALSQLTPVLSAELLYLCGIFETGRFLTLNDGILAYKTDRSRNAPWNDGWGRPLMVGFALFQPRKNTGIKFGIFNASAGAPQDYFLKRAKVAYGYDRSVYISIGAIGPKLPVGIADSDLTSASADWTSTSTGILAKAWQGIHDVINVQVPLERWRTDASFNAFATPPWDDVQRGRHNGLFCLLSTPVEFQ